MTDDDIRYMHNPATAVIVPAEANKPNVFGFIVAFPKDLDAESNVKLAISSGPHKDNEILDPKLCKDYCQQVVEALMKRGRMDLVSSTNWASVTAAIQRVLNDWNAKRAPGSRSVQ